VNAAVHFVRALKLFDDFALKSRKKEFLLLYFHFGLLQLEYIVICYNLADTIKLGHKIMYVFCVPPQIQMENDEYNNFNVSIIFFLLVGWEFWYCGHYWPIVPAPDDR
jgi:hypothetical protein